MNDVDSVFCDNIMSGISNYMAYRYGNLQKDKNWIPIEKPNANTLVQNVVAEIEKHPMHWFHNRSASEAIQACTYVVKTTENAARIVFLILGFKYLNEDRESGRDSRSLINAGINMIKGRVTEGLMILANNFIKKDIPFPELLVPALFHFARDEHPAIRSVILNRLRYLLYYKPEVGWNLLYSALHDSEGLWSVAESCLYQMYYKHFDRVGPLLDRLYKEGRGKDLETWGRISALAVLANHIDIEKFLKNLNELNSSDAWFGASNVWTHSGNFQKNREDCLLGIRNGLKSGNASITVAEEMIKFFRSDHFILIPIDILELCLSVFAENGKDQNRFYGLDEWLNALAQYNPDMALDGIETYIVFAMRTTSYLYDYENNLTQLMTRLFAEAEEREESDNGNMLQRVVSVQDKLLSLGVNGINTWLEAAERQ